MKNPTAALAAGAAVVTIALTGAAFWLSYEHLHDIAGGNGLGGARAWAWPATVDLFIIAGELLVLRASLRGAVDRWAYALAAVGSLGSIALNVFGVGDSAQPMEYVVAAVPPSAALIAFGALMRQVHDALHRAQTAADPMQPDAGDDFERAAEQAVEVADSDARAAFVLDFHPHPQPHPDVCATASAAAHAPDAPAQQPESAPAASDAIVRPMPTPAADADLLAAALEVNATALAETGQRASLRRLQSELRIGQKRAQRIQAQLPDALPAPASKEA
ncbi:DUF2637 domain-containing protein [Streptomyces sp. F-1]|uniref:DUF2637 domain-containing protein n=1 Tax=Streptomyces sp. F-1 TaxID=463642 RepID=UPI000869508C|nr:DUF2637 domain-containing protein [Streptomyces sp. F-1]SFY52073.1 hypothetical protein STEPF1_05342 [Streptomyces sp. F-1]